MSAVLIILGVILILLIAVLVCQYCIVYAIRRVSISLEQIADSKRLSMVISIEGKKNLDITPEDFEPKKEIILTKMLEELSSVDARKRWEDDPQTFAFVILDHSGFNLFIESSLSLKLQKTLGRLLANHEFSKAGRIIKQMVKAL